MTTSFLDGSCLGRAILRAKEELTICGLDLISPIFALMEIENIPYITMLCSDGDRLSIGDTVCEIHGDAATLLMAERTILNFLQRMSGIATTTAHFVSYLPEGSKTRITDTRKTTPGWRTLEKYAVRVGGAYNHRFGLDDGVMIKDNHIVLAGSITNAVKDIRDKIHHLMRIEVECENQEMVKEALNAGADVIMCDNMSTDDVAAAVNLINGSAIVEVSGGISFERIQELATVGVDVISVGKLTHGARSVDINMTLTVE
ncbi:carboxylating nicotinate-nucleotide diphosphorylase [bacterium]|nr:carboxylating nicotinate-nucleotide diphosphorylase [bacterium]